MGTRTSEPFEEYAQPLALSRKRNTILCREMLFYDREVDFIIQVWVDRGDGDCHVIPAHRRADRLEEN